MYTSSNFSNWKIKDLKCALPQLFKLENRKSKIEYISQPNDVHFLGLFLQFPSQPSRRAANARDSKGPAAKLLIQRPESTWKTPQTDDCPSALGRNSKVGQCQASKARDPTWKKTLEFEAGIRPPITTKMKKLDSSRDLCSGVKCDLGGSSKWIELNRRNDRSGKLVTWYNGPLILGPICWPSQD